jgi:hypothetical protein
MSGATMFGTDEKASITSTRRALTPTNIMQWLFSNESSRQTEGWFSTALLFTTTGHQAPVLAARRQPQPAKRPLRSDPNTPQRKAEMGVRMA